MKISLALLCCTAFITSLAWANEVKTHINKNTTGKWIVTFSTSEPVDRIEMLISPDDSRTNRWQPVNNDKVIKYHGNKEFIVDAEGEKFSQVSFYLTPTYVALKKAYAPFSPFSDGALLFYSGRFFACAQKCDDELNQWSFTLSVPADEHIVLKGEVHKNLVSWVDSNSGTKVYVGAKQPIKTPDFIAIIDEGLPQQLKRALASNMPTLAAYYSEKLGKLGARPMLFASYGETHDEGYGNQGGTLPGQVFMHWYGDNLEQRIDTFSTYWFFSHEVAHIFQREGKDIEKRAEQWIHEGAAEYMAAVSVKALSEEIGDKVKAKFLAAKSHCLKGTVNKGFAEQVAKGNTRLLYTCGLGIWMTIEKELGKQVPAKDIFWVWNQYQQKVVEGNQPGIDSLLMVLSPILPQDLLTQIQGYQSLNSKNFEAMFGE